MLVFGSVDYWLQDQNLMVFLLAPPLPAGFFSFLSDAATGEMFAATKGGDGTTERRTLPEVHC
jgi:hypothetical protein